MFNAQHQPLGHRPQKSSPGGTDFTEQHLGSELEVGCHHLPPCLQHNTAEVLRLAARSEAAAQDTSPYSQHSPSVSQASRQGLFEGTKLDDVTQQKPSLRAPVVENVGSPPRHMESDHRRCEELLLEGITERDYSSHDLSKVLDQQTFPQHSSTVVSSSSVQQATHSQKRQQLLSEAGRLYREQMNTQQVSSPQQQAHKGGLNISLIVEAVIAAAQSVPRPNSALLLQLLELLVAVVAQQPQGQGLTPSDLSALETAIEAVAKQELLEQQVQQEKIQQQVQQERLKQMSHDSCLGPTDLAALETAIEAMNELQQQQQQPPLPLEHKQIQQHRSKNPVLGISNEILSDTAAVDMSPVHSVGQIAPGSSYSAGTAGGTSATSTACTREHFKRVPIPVFLQEMYQGPPLPILSSSALAFGSSSESDSEERRLRKRKKERRVNAAAPDALWHPHFHPHNQVGVRVVPL